MQKTCANGWCKAPFEVTDEDLAFYDKVSPVFGEKKYPIPPPTMCRDCRLQRRLVWRNERMLYSRECASCKKKQVSIFSPETTLPIYCNTCWWADSFDGRDYGAAFDFNVPFFDQFQKLRDRTPQLAIMNDNGVGSENCEYCQDFAFGKNCYMVVGTWQTQNSLYSTESSDHSKYICDCTYVSKSELTYESIDSRLLYHCAFLQNSDNCSDCFYGFDLKGCKHCFGCVSLRQKEYCFFNEQLSKGEYDQRIAPYLRGSWKSHQEINERFWKWALAFPRRAMNLTACENCEGNHLYNSNNTFGFNAYNCESCKFYDRGDSPKFSYDIFQSGHNEWCYEGMVPDNSYMALFCLWCWKDKNVSYSDNCHSSEHLFGCISLKRATYCILNKQYSKNEYEQLVPQIIEHMQRTGEWGEFFPAEKATYGYNETTAQEYFPLTENEAQKRGYHWQKPDKREYKPSTTILADCITETTDAITNEILACDECNKNYKITNQEFTLYNQLILPIPRKCPQCRHADRAKRRTPYKLWERECAKCHKPIATSYSPERPEIVYCEECYLKEVY